MILETGQTFDTNQEASLQLQECMEDIQADLGDFSAELPVPHPIGEQNEVLEDDATRIARIDAQIAEVLQDLEGGADINKTNFLTRCKHETGDYYSGIFSKSRYRQASIKCDQYPNGITMEIDRISASKPLIHTSYRKNKQHKSVAHHTPLTINQVPIYGGYNLSNASYQGRRYKDNQTIPGKDYGSMASKDVNQEGQVVAFDLHIFGSMKDFVQNMIQIWKRAGVQKDDTMMYTMAKLSGKVGYNGYGYESLVKYANSGFIRDRKKSQDKSPSIDIVLGQGESVSNTIKIIKQQFTYQDATNQGLFMNELRTTTPALYNAYIGFFELTDDALNTLSTQDIIQSNDTYYAVFPGAYTPSSTYHIIKLVPPSSPSPNTLK